MARDDLAGVVGGGQLDRYDVVEGFGVVLRCIAGAEFVGERCGPGEGIDDVAHDLQGVRVVLGEMIGDA